MIVAQAFLPVCAWSKLCNTSNCLRSSKEIASRLKQEIRNVRLWARPPRLATTRSLSPRRLPIDTAAIVSQLRGTAFEANVVRLADQICQHRFPLLGITIETGPDIAWRRDYLCGKETGLDYFRRIPYLDAGKAGDHKIIWELNRHQHLVLLAQAFLFTGDARHLSEIQAQVESWISANPFHRGINWASALEAGFRALSWVWIDQLVGDRLPPEFRKRLFAQLYLHGCHLENNLSFYFSPNTHLLGEAVSLHALSVLFPNLPNAGRWEQLSGRVINEQMHSQVRDDGSHFEQSTYYHVYALDMFLLHGIVTEPGPWYRDKLRRMAEYLHYLLGPARKLAFLGDDDGGRLFHPFGRQDEYGRSTMATCSVFLDRPEWLYSTEDLHAQAAWWLGSEVLQRQPAGRSDWESRLFTDAGVAVMRSGDRQITADAGPFGPWGSGHSHSDTLSVVARADDREILIDPGTYTYVADPKWREWFRGSGAHSTVRIDALDQATPMGPFRWANQPEARILQWTSDAEQDYLDADCRYRGFTHRRRIRFVKPDLLLIVDDISGPAGEHDVEQIWHLGSMEARNCLVVAKDAEAIESWRSIAFGDKRPGVAMRVRRRGELPMRLCAGIVLTPGVSLEIQDGVFRYRVGGGEERVALFDQS